MVFRTANFLGEFKHWLCFAKHDANTMLNVTPDLAKKQTLGLKFNILCMAKHDAAFHFKACIFCQKRVFWGFAYVPNFGIGGVKFEIYFVGKLSKLFLYETMGLPSINTHSPWVPRRFGLAVLGWQLLLDKT